MDNKYHMAPVGSVVDHSGIRLLVIGYETTKQEDHYEMQYVVVPYPVGFCTTEHLKMVPYDQVTLVTRGFVDARSEAAVGYVGGLANLFDAFTAQQIDEQLQNAAVQEGKTDE